MNLSLFCMSGKTMKLKDLIQELSKLGVTFISHGANHDLYARMKRKFPFHVMQRSTNYLQNPFLKRPRTSDT